MTTPNEAAQREAADNLHQQIDAIQDDRKGREVEARNAAARLHVDTRPFESTENLTARPEDGGELADLDGLKAAMHQAVDQRNAADDAEPDAPPSAEPNGDAPDDVGQGQGEPAPPIDVANDVAIGEVEADLDAARAAGDVDAEAEALDNLAAAESESGGDGDFSREKSAAISSAIKDVGDALGLGGGQGAPSPPDNPIFAPEGATPSVSITAPVLPPPEAKGGGGQRQPRQRQPRPKYGAPPKPPKAKSARHPFLSRRESR